MTAQTMLAMAASQLGYVQHGDTIYGDWYGARHNDPGDDVADWCAMFLAWCGFKTGQGDVVGEFAWVPSYLEWFRGRGQFGAGPRVGALVFMDFVLGLSGEGSHVGIVETVNGDGTVGTIEGNTGTPGEVARRTRSADILGYGYPAYHSIPIEEDDMYGELKDGNTEPTILSWPAGNVHAIGFGCDNGFQQLPAAQLRVAVHSRAGGWSQILDPIMVDSSKGKTVIAFTAQDVDIVSVARLDDGVVAVSWDAS